LLRRKIIRFIHFQWKDNRSGQLRQFLFRLLPLIFTFILSAGSVELFRNVSLRSVLDNSAFKNFSSGTFQAVNGYFSPLIEFLYSSALWGRIGDVNSLGVPSEYLNFLTTRLKQLDGISTFSLSGADGNELVIDLLENGPKSWYTTTLDSDNSLSFLRKKNSIKYSSLDIADPINPLNPKEEIPIQVSSPYILPYLSMPGITLRLNSTSYTAGKGLTIWLDLPLKKMAERLKEEGALKDAVIFLLMPSQKDFIMISVGDILTLKTEDLERKIPKDLNTLKGGEKLILDTLLEAKKESTEDKVNFKFTYAGNNWLSEFRFINLGDDILSFGSLIPENSLWTTQASVPLQIFMIILLLSTIFLIFRLVQEYRHIPGKIPSPEELLGKKINQGETHTMEFKSSLRWDYKMGELNKSLEEVIIKSIAAFNNSDGGKLLIGVSDDGKIIGLENDYRVMKEPGKDFYELHLRNLLSSRYGLGYTTKNLKISFPVIEKFEICQIQIKRGKEPLYTKISKKGSGPVEKFYIRSGNASRVLENISEGTEYIISRFHHFSKRN